MVWTLNCLAHAGLQTELSYRVTPNCRDSLYQRTADLFKCTVKSGARMSTWNRGRPIV